MADVAVVAGKQRPLLFFVLEAAIDRINKKSAELLYMLHVHVLHM